MRRSTRLIWIPLVLANRTSNKAMMSVGDVDDGDGDVVAAGTRTAIPCRQTVLLLQSNPD